VGAGPPKRGSPEIVWGLLWRADGDKGGIAKGLLTVVVITHQIEYYHDQGS